MKRFVTEYATELKLTLIQRFNNGFLTKEQYLETCDRIDTVISICKRGLLCNREAVKEIMQIFEEVY